MPACVLILNSTSIRAAFDGRDCSLFSNICTRTATRCRPASSQKSHAVAVIHPHELAMASTLSALITNGSSRGKDTTVTLPGTTTPASQSATAGATSSGTFAKRIPSLRHPDVPNSPTNTDSATQCRRRARPGRNLREREREGGGGGEQYHWNCPPRPTAHHNETTSRNHMR
jgi:hypothetical protein